MPGLTAKVFRTYNASTTLQEQLKVRLAPTHLAGVHVQLCLPVYMQHEDMQCMHKDMHHDAHSRMHCPLPRCIRCPALFSAPGRRQPHMCVWYIHTPSSSALTRGRGGGAGGLHPIPLVRALLPHLRPPFACMHAFVVDAWWVLPYARGGVGYAC